MRYHLLAVLTMVALLTIHGSAQAQGVDTFSTDLPPEGQYVSPDEYHTYLALGITLDDPIHTPILARGVQRAAVGNDEHETFSSAFDAVVVGFGPVHLEGPVTVRTTDRLLSTTGTFDTEIIAMSLSGNTPMGPVLIQVDPNPLRPSTGQTDIL
ncbi:hypothetical protein LCGC14_2888240, partial [marine sediment metagenome]